MARSEFFDVLNGQSAAPPGPLLQALEARICYVIERTEDPTTLEPGAITKLCFGGIIFEFDPADTTSVHDGVTVIVTADGKRFKSDGFAGKQITSRSVLDKDLATPPGSPSLGDRYIVAAGGTGAWAGRDKNIAEYTARGWVFHAPERWDIALVNDEVAFYHYNASAVWTLGLPGSQVAANSIGITELQFGLGLAIQSQTVNDPPGSPSEGVAYIVGPSPTGAWDGEAGNLTIYEGGSWIFYTPQSGWNVFNLATNRVLYYVAGSGWIDPLSGAAGVVLQVATTDTGATANTSYASGVDVITLDFTAFAAGNLLEITFKARGFVLDVSGGSITSSFLDLRVDSESDARDTLFASEEGAADADGEVEYISVTVMLTAQDALAHTYRVRARGGDGWTMIADNAGTTQTLPPQLTIKEIVQNA